ncbi:hypothetical protein GRZ55_11330 [Chelativorans sp. ZYF759]|uniref:phage regulatory CII family protein n=1 Tax=Chelativorans sp. ZYF759 TaxID=2692213 RepID=UPI00145FCD9A|nr:phage regulatory CII family protein [Chelativorans sp. ZYF759]NMG39836.1 hypothetical protein [Chelativorans sp. ZYF759]
MAELRETTPQERRALSMSVRRAAKLGGGAASVQHMTRVGEADLSRYGAPEQDDRHCPIDVAVDLDRMAGGPVVVAAMATLLGYRLVAEARPANGDLCLREIARIGSESAEVVAAILHAMADGTLCEADRRRINMEIEEACRVLRSVQGRLGTIGIVVKNNAGGDFP